MALLEQALRTEATVSAGSGTFRKEMLTSEARRAERADKARSAVPTSGGRRPERAEMLANGSPRTPGALAPQEDDPGGCEAELDIPTGP
jgi:hypothetical protein